MGTIYYYLPFAFCPSLNIISKTVCFFSFRLVVPPFSVLMEYVRMVRYIYACEYFYYPKKEQQDHEWDDTGSYNHDSEGLDESI